MEKKLDGHNVCHFLLDKLGESRTTLFPDIRETCSFPWIPHDGW